MRCYFHYEKSDGKKYLIPYCNGTMHSEDIGDCVCPKPLRITKERSVLRMDCDLNSCAIENALLF